MSQNAFEELIWGNRDYDGCENVTKVNFRSFKPRLFILFRFVKYKNLRRIHLGMKWN